MDMIFVLMLVTLVAGLAVALVQLLKFMQRRGDRRIAEAALTGSGRRRDAGALSDLAAVASVSVFAMALLVLGYVYRPTGDEVPSVRIDRTSSDSAAEQMTEPAQPRVDGAETAQPPVQYPLGSGSPNPPAAPMLPAPTPPQP